MHPDPLLLVWAFIVTMTLAVVMLERARRKDDRAALAIEASVEASEEMEAVADYVQQILPLQIKAHQELIVEIQKTARRLAAGGREISSDDVIEVVKIPDGIDPRIMGCTFHPRKDWERVRFQPSRLSRRNKRPVSVWRLRASTQHPS